MTAAPKNRIAWTGGWHYAHNNPRQEELLPRLSNVDRYYVHLPHFWPLRGVRRRIWLPLLVRWLGWRYPLLFSTDWRQIGMVRSRVVCDHDDPVFSDPEITALNLPNVAAVVTTSDAVRRNLQDAGVRRPIEVIPQGVAMKRADPERVRAIRRRYAAVAGEVVVGMHQPRFAYASELTPDSPEQMYAVDPLFDIMERARARDARLVLWLVGAPDRRVREYADRNRWVRLIGYKPRVELAEYVSTFDIGLYPRNLDLKGRTSVKVVEYMACGVPVVGFDVEEMRVAMQGGAGIVGRSTDDISSALADLAADERRRLLLGGEGRTAAAAYDWDVLAERYRGLLERAFLYGDKE
jgi:glycosyltransferase involved in cell wall biosynthesis